VLSCSSRGPTDRRPRESARTTALWYATGEPPITQRIRGSSRSSTRPPARPMARRNASWFPSIAGSLFSTCRRLARCPCLPSQGVLDRHAVDADIAPVTTLAHPTTTPVSTRTPVGVVHVKGLVMCSPAVGTVCFNGPIFTLPLGYWPAGQKIFPVLRDNALARVDIFTSGEVAPNSNSGNGQWVNLEGITFRAG